MKRLFPFLMLLAFSLLPFCEVYSQKSKDKIVFPQYPGGESELHKFILSELQYPYEARVNKETGEVLVAFSVGMDGYITGVHGRGMLLLLAQNIHLSDNSAGDVGS